MTMIRTLGLAAAALVAGAAAAHAGTAGAYAVTVGANQAACGVTFASGVSDNVGTAETAADCPARTTQIARWSANGNKITLKSASGETIAVLASEGDAYVGRSVTDSRKIVLTRTGAQNVAQGQ